MKIKKLLGFAMMILGLASVVIKLVFSNLIENTFLANIETMWFIIAGLFLIALGFLVSKKKAPKTKGQSSEEVPIYQGDKIIGYRKK